MTTKRKRGHPKGVAQHNKTTVKGKVTLLFGVGCPTHPSCFTCPEPDCNYNGG